MADLGQSSCRCVIPHANENCVLKLNYMMGRREQNLGDSFPDSFPDKRSSNSDVRESVALLSAQYGWPLRTVFRDEPTLEDVFVEMTRKD